MFIFKDISSDDMGLIVTKEPNIEIPQREVEEIKINGKDGAYTITKDYNLITKLIEVHYEGKDWDKLSSWLSGSGDLILSSFNDRYYKAHINNNIDINSIIKNKLSKFIINFKCQPFGYKRSNSAIDLIVGENTLNNTGTVFSEPVIKVEGTGKAQIKITNGSFVQDISILDIGGKIIINSEDKIAYGDNTNKSTSVLGGYPILKTGTNKILVSGNITKISIIPNMRFLI